MREVERTFELTNKDIEFIQENLKNILHNILDFSTNTKTSISFFNKSINPEFQKKNKIVIHHDNEKLFVLVKGEISEIENDIIWAELEKIIKESEVLKKEKEDTIVRDDLKKRIVERVKNEGFSFELKDAEKFIMNFNKKFNRYPKPEEIDSIGIGYIKMLNEKMSSEEEQLNLVKSITFQKESEQLPVKTNNDKDENQLKKDKKTLQNKNLIEIKKSEGRRTCPDCGNKNISTIRELIDKQTIISHYPKIFAKKYQCRLCNCEWKEI